MASPCQQRLALSPSAVITETQGIPELSVGTQVTFTVTFDDAAPDSYPDPSFGQYQSPNDVPFGFVFEGASYRLARTANITVEVGNNTTIGCSPICDMIRLRTPYDLLAFLQVGFGGPDLTVISDDSLTLQPPNASLFQTSTFSLFPNGYTTPFSPYAFGRITSVQPAPVNDTTTCGPPSFLFVDDEHAVPLSGATLLNQGVSRCQRTGDVRIVNKLGGVWLGIERIRTRSAVDDGVRPTVVPLSSDQRLQDWARFRVIPPCRFDGVFDPVCDPGVSSWRTSFSEPGTVHFTISLTGRALSLTVLDLLFGFAGLTPTEFMELADELEQVPTIHQAIRCLRATDKERLKGGVDCAVIELTKLTTRWRQQRQIVQILGRHGVNMGVEELLAKVAGFAAVAPFELATSLGVWFATAVFSEDPGALAIVVEAR